MKMILTLCLIFCLLGIHSGVLADNYSFVTFRFPPLEYGGDDGKAQGITVEIVRKVINNLGHNVEIKVFPWTRALMMVRKGTADAIFTAYKNPEREKFMDYSNQILFPQIVYFYKKKGVKIDFDGDLKTLKNIRIGVVSTISYGKKFDQIKSKLNLDKANKLEQNFEKLLLGRIDLVPCNVHVAEYTLHHLGWADKIVRVSLKIERVPSYIAFSKKRNLEALRDQFDQEIEKMKINGEYGKILNKYGVNIKEFY